MYVCIDFKEILHCMEDFLIQLHTYNISNKFGNVSHRNFTYHICICTYKIHNLLGRKILLTYKILEFFGEHIQVF